MKTIKIKVKGMHCQSCETLVEEDIEDLPGVKDAEADEKAGDVDVIYDEDKVSLDKIKKAIKDAGYEPE